MQPTSLYTVLYVVCVRPLRIVTYVQPTKCYLRSATYVITYCSLRSLSTSSTYCYLRAAYEVYSTYCSLRRKTTFYVVNKCSLRRELSLSTSQSFANCSLRTDTYVSYLRSTKCNLRSVAYVEQFSIHKHPT